jgi:hypothetical protein
MCITLALTTSSLLKTIVYICFLIYMIDAPYILIIQMYVILTNINCFDFMFFRNILVTST